MPDQLLITQNAPTTAFPAVTSISTGPTTSLTLEYEQSLVLNDGSVMILRYFEGTAWRFEGLSGYFSYPSRRLTLTHIDHDDEVVNTETLASSIASGGSIWRSRYAAEFRENAEGDLSVYFITEQNYRRDGWRTTRVNSVAISPTGEIWDITSLSYLGEQPSYYGTRFDLEDGSYLVLRFTNANVAVPAVQPWQVEKFDAEGVSLNGPVLLEGTVSGAELGADNLLTVRALLSNGALVNHVFSANGELQTSPSSLRPLVSLKF